MTTRDRVDWTAARDEYVTGEKSLAKIADAFGVSVRAVEKRASDRAANGGRTWGEWRVEFRGSVSEETASVLKRIKVGTAVRIAIQHATIMAELAGQASEAVAGVLEKCKPRDKVKLTLAIIAMERRVHGLDRVPVRVEVTGKDGARIEHDVDFEIDDESRALAERLLRDVFGK